jgi:hypothetical protein
VIVGLAASGALAWGTADTSSTSTTFYACLKSGELSNVGTTPPTCPTKSTRISWNQQGPAGVSGLNGKTVLNGSGAPSNALGTNGDFYLDTADTKLYGPKAAGAWPASGVSLVGAGGTPGANGTDGLNGKSILNGSGAPSDSAGTDGDFYLDTADTKLYGPKAAGAWPASGVSLVGATGAGGTGQSNAYEFSSEGDNVTVLVELAGGQVTIPSGANHKVFWSFSAGATHLNLNQKLLEWTMSVDGVQVNPAPAFVSLDERPALLSSSGITTLTAGTHTVSLKFRDSSPPATGYEIQVFQVRLDVIDLGTA